jgi:hypothetical protein
MRARAGFVGRDCRKIEVTRIEGFADGG